MNQSTLNEIRRIATEMREYDHNVELLSETHHEYESNPLYGDEVVMITGIFSESKRVPGTIHVKVMKEDLLRFLEGQIAKYEVIAKQYHNEFDKL